MLLHVSAQSERLLPNSSRRRRRRRGDWSAAATGKETAASS